MTDKDKQTGGFVPASTTAPAPPAATIPPAPAAPTPAFEAQVADRLADLARQKNGEA